MDYTPKIRLHVSCLDRKQFSETDRSGHSARGLARHNARKQIRFAKSKTKTHCNNDVYFKNELMIPKHV